MANNTILIVDDEPMIFDVLAKAFKAKGFNVIVAYDGLEAVESAKRDKPILIILDLHIPKLGGLRVCESLREDVNTSNIPIVILTALDSTQNREAAGGLGVKDFLTKPFKVEEVLEKIEKYLPGGK